MSNESKPSTRSLAVADAIRALCAAGADAPGLGNAIATLIDEVILAVTESADHHAADALDAAARARGWASAHEHVAYTAPEREPLFVIQDTRSLVGNTPLFWMPNANGYGSVISDVGRYTKAEAFGKRETDFPVPLEIAVACARPRIDVQLLHATLEQRGLPKPKPVTMARRARR